MAIAFDDLKAISIGNDANWSLIDIMHAWVIVFLHGLDVDAIYCNEKERCNSTKKCYQLPQPFLFTEATISIFSVFFFFV